MYLARPLTGGEGDRTLHVAAEPRSLHQLARFRQSGTGLNGQVQPRSEVLVDLPKMATLRVISEGQEA